MRGKTTKGSILPKNKHWKRYSPCSQYQGDGRPKDFYLLPSTSFFFLRSLFILNETSSKQKQPEKRDKKGSRETNIALFFIKSQNYRRRYQGNNKKIAIFAELNTHLDYILTEIEFSAKQIADFIGGRVEGDDNAKVNTFAKIEEGVPGAISFLSNPKYTHFIYETKSSIVLINEDMKLEQPVETTLIRVANA